MEIGYEGLDNTLGWVDNYLFANPSKSPELGLDENGKVSKLSFVKSIESI